MDTQKASGASGQYLTFSLGEEEYGIEILSVQEIRGYSAVTPLPNSPAYIKGVINLRGTVVPVVDLRARFAMAAAAYTKFTVIVVVTLADRVVGMLVDAVSDVLDIPVGELKAPPEMPGCGPARYIRGIASSGERLTVVLDVPRLLEEYEGAPAMAAEALAVN